MPVVTPTYIKTPVSGSENFPANENDVYGLIETLVVQEINNVKTANRLDDALFYYDLTEANGTVIEQAVIDKATAQAYDKTKCGFFMEDPKLAVRYFNNWETVQYPALVRKDDIRRIIANKGVGVEDVVAKILDTMTQARDSAFFKNARSLLLDTELPAYDIIIGGTPLNMNGVLYMIRDMYEALRDDNTGLSGIDFEQSTPESDIRIAISSKLLNLIDVTKLADVMNLSRVELFGRIVVVPVSDLDQSMWYKVVAYDRKAMNRAIRINDITNAECAKGRFREYYLTVESAYFYSPLFKAVQLDVSAAAQAEYNKIIGPLE